MNLIFGSIAVGLGIVLVYDQWERWAERRAGRATTTDHRRQLFLERDTATGVIGCRTPTSPDDASTNRGER